MEKHPTRTMEIVNVRDNGSALDFIVRTNFDISDARKTSYEFIRRHALRWSADGLGIERIRGSRRDLRRMSNYWEISSVTQLAESVIQIELQSRN